MLSDFFLTAVGSALAGFLILAELTGIPLALGAATARELSHSYALRLGLAAGVVLVLSMPLLVYLRSVFLVPAGFDFLYLPFAFLLIPLITFLLGLGVTAKRPDLVRSAQAHVPVVAGSSALLAAPLLVHQDVSGPIPVLAQALGLASGLVLAMTLYSAIRHRIQEDQLPPAFRGLPISLLVLGMMALAVSGLAGLGA